MKQFTIPREGWELRDYQRPMWQAAMAGKNVAAVWHRRAGKDEVLLNALAVKALQRPASYAYMFPEAAQARRMMWQMMNPHTGKRRILEAFPREMLLSDPNETEMRLNLVNGSVITFFGSDNYDRLVGGALAGIVSSEHALAHPNAYAYFSPMLLENGGFFWAISTPRGENHFKTMYDMACEDEEWFAEHLTVYKTKALTDEQIAKARWRYQKLYGTSQGNALFQQEYEVDFNAALMGAYYGDEMRAVKDEGRIDPDLKAIEGVPVHRAWDIGVRDDTSIWWFQVVGSQIYILDCWSEPGMSDIREFASLVRKKNEENGWTDGVDYVPHDARQRVWGMAKGRLETMQEHGLRPEVVPDMSVLDGINAARLTIPRCVFHPNSKEKGILALEQYQREWDDKHKVFRQNPLHNWASHPADAFRYLALSWRKAYSPPEKPAPSLKMDADRMTLDAIRKRRK